MTKKELINYISGLSGKEERERVLLWINQNPNNLKYFTQLKSIWVKSNLPQSVASEEELQEFYKKVATTNRPATNRFKGYFWAASIAALLLLIVNILQFINSSGEGEQSGRITLKESAPEQLHTLYTNNGVKANVILPDGSSVWLNSASRLTYPSQFEGATREVHVKGEALFDVVSDSLKPMIVNTDRGFMVEVVGTKFNIRAYDGDNEAQTTLISGSVKLTREVKGGKREVIAHLKPKESFIVREKESPIVLKQTDTTKQIAWKNGLLIFEATPLPEVITKLERWHGTKFIVEDPSVLTAKLTANFRSESIVQIMEMIRFCTHLEYSIEENTVTIFKK